jgi:hypothetical protein
VDECAVYFGIPWAESEFIDCWVGTCADDIAKFAKVSSSTSASRLVAQHDLHLNQALQGSPVMQSKFEQNADKPVILPHFVGKGSVAYYNRLFEVPLQGQVAHIAKYLGTLNHFKGGRSSEVAHRIRAARIAWYSFRGFWQAAPRRFAFRVFRAVVLSTLFYALEVRALNDKDHRNIDAFMSKCARSLLFGTAHTELEGKHRSLSNVQVLEKTGVAPATTELFCRRVRFWLGCIRNQTKFEQLWAALLGDS